VDVALAASSSELLRLELPLEALDVVDVVDSTVGLDREKPENRDRERARPSGFAIFFYFWGLSDSAPLMSPLLLLT